MNQKKLKKLGREETKKQKPGEQSSREKRHLRHCQILHRDYKGWHMRKGYRIQQEVGHWQNLETVFNVVVTEPKQKGFKAKMSRWEV